MRLARALVYGFVCMLGTIIVAIVLGFLIEYWIWLWGMFFSWVAFVPLAVAPLALIVGTLLAPAEEPDANLQKGSENG